MGAARWLALVAVALLGGCGDDFSDDFNLLDRLRLIDVVGEPPEVAANDRTSLTAVAVDRGGQDGSPIAIRWIACLLPPVPGYAVNPECMNEDLTRPYLVALGSGAALDLTVPAVPDAVLSQPDVTGGVYLPLRLRLTNATEALDAVYRLRYARGDGARNRNPVIAGVFLVTEANGAVTSETELKEDAPLPVRAGDRLGLRARFTAESSEPFQVTTVDGTVRYVAETMSASWFATAGHFSDGNTGADATTVLDLGRNPPPAGANVDVYVVGRDGRGGSAWAHRVLQVQ